MTGAGAAPATARATTASRCRRGPGRWPRRCARSGYATGAFVSGFPLARAFGVDRGFGHFDDALPDGPPDRRERRARRHDRGRGRLDRAGARAVVRRGSTTTTRTIPTTHRGAPRADARAALRRGGRVRGRRVRPPARGRRPAPARCSDRAHGGPRREPGRARRADARVLPVREHRRGAARRPLLPAASRPGESDAPARLVDVAPTLLDLRASPGSADVDGVSLAPLLSGRAQTCRPPTIETLRPWASYGWAPLAALRDGDWKLVDAPRPELYDVARDPGERTRPAPRGARARGAR